MTLLVLAYLGGVLTIISPCILPVLPFVFARADRPFVKSGLPMLVGMAITFAAIATLAVVAGGWAVDANQYGRAIAVVVLGARVQAGKTLDGKNPWRSCSTHIDSAEEIQDLVASLGEFFPRLAIIPVPTSVADHKTGVNSSTDHGGEKGGPIPIEVKPAFIAFSRSSQSVPRAGAIMLTLTPSD